MNKQDITIVVILALLLGGWLFYQNGQVKKQRAALLERQREAAMAAATNPVPETATAPLSAETLEKGTTLSAAPATNSTAAATTNLPPAVVAEPDTDVPEQTLLLRDGEAELTLSSKGGTIVSTKLAGYRQSLPKDSENVVLDSSSFKILALEGLPGLGAKADFETVSSSETNAVFRCTTDSGLSLVREISILPNYQVNVRDTFENTTAAPVALADNAVSMGEVKRIEKTRNNLLSVDALSAATDRHGNLGKVDHWEKKGRVNGVLTGRNSSGGCAGAPNAALLPETGSITIDEPQMWVAIKSRFFTQVLTSSVPNKGYRIGVRRSTENGPLQIESVNGAVLFPAAVINPGEKLERSYLLYIGPKKFSVLRHFGPKSGDIMDFGTWKYICIVVLWLLNVLYAACHNYGIAIILITILVRVAFWPLTHKSTESMKKMQEIQPLLKEIQTKFKDDPQKLQQETMEIYRKNKVNPMSSCLPMLIQIPFFIAIFYVLRSAVELRFAPFLWIADLSEPENLFAGMIPFIHSINFLPLIMAATMFLQSKLTPSMGDPSQQKMMMWMMPLMMLFMFYQMPSALVLYWSVSQILAIIQLWRQRKGAQNKNGTVAADAEPMTRQARRRAERES